MENRIASLDPDERIYRKLVDSPFFQTYRRAFTNATGLGLVLLSADDEIENLDQGRHFAPFCKALNESAAGCQRCHLEHCCLAREVGDKAETRTCFAGMRETLIPIRAGKKTVAFLSTGQVFTTPSAERDFTKVADQLRRVGFKEAQLADLARVWENTPEFGLERYEGTITLLAAFALQLSDLLNRLLTEESNSEPQIVVKAKRFINAHLEEKLSLDSVAGHVGVSPFYFCKLFKQATDMTLTEYVNRRRIEWAKRKLLNPNSRVTEVAFDVGFQSVSQFNRSFLKYVGTSPTRFRIDGPRSQSTDIACSEAA
ncbi:MAG: helix-turn-helix domain-containing protein [Verrucomicrobiae bacterium]|nr:helix-turn-helix domain-containing protein [Verrucomicrobiae bacterium]